MTRKHKGVGIGLSLCKRIVDYIGGELWVESKEDVGSKFIFTLPIYKKDGEFMVIMAETDRLGAEKIIGRMKGKVKIPLNFGVVVYPDDAKEKDELIKEAEKKLKSKKNTL